MRVMIANNCGLVAGWLAGRFPGLLGHIYSPGGFRGPWDFMPFALDNGRFAAGDSWDADAFLGMLDRVAGLAASPLWVVVPDVVGDRDGTLREWDKWAPRVKSVGGWKLAMAVQDGMQPEDVPEDADVVFVGGSTEFKRGTLHVWCDAFPRVHVGRINTDRWLWECNRAGAESCDGTGWFRGDKRQFKGLEDYLTRVSAGESEPQLQFVYKGDYDDGR